MMEGRADYDEVNRTISSGEVKVNPGDLILADMDWIVAIPGEIARKVIKTAEEIVFRNDV